MILENQCKQIDMINLTISIIALIFSIVMPIIIFWLYKKLDDLKEKKLLKVAFLRIKSYLQVKLEGKKSNKAHMGSMPFFMNLQNSRPDILIKLGVEVNRKTPTPTVKGFESEPIAYMIILDKYLLGEGGQFENWVTHEKVEIRKESLESILSEIILCLKENFGIKLNTNLSTLNKT